MVCGSGSVYCASVKFSKKVQHCSSSSESLNLSAADLEAETLMLLEDVRIKSDDNLSEGRTLWDGGSNRILINNDFARENKLKSQEISYRLSVIGGKGSIEKGLIHQVEIIDNNEQVAKVWGFGMDVSLQNL